MPLPYNPPLSTSSVMGGCPPSLHHPQGPPPLIRYNFQFSLEAELCKNCFSHPQAEVPTLNRHQEPPPPPPQALRAGQWRRGGPGPAPAPGSPAPGSGLWPGRSSPVQHLDLHIFPRSKIMARRWLRSPRIRNTFMFQPAGPAPARSQLPGNFLAGEAAATSLAWPVGPARPCPRLRAPLRPGAAAPPARSRTGGDVARPAVAQRSQEAPPARGPAPGPFQSLAPGRAGRPGQAGGFRPGPAARCRGDSVPARGRPRPAPLMPGVRSASPPQNRGPPSRDPGQATGSLSPPQSPHLLQLITVPG